MEGFRGLGVEREFHLTFPRAISADDLEWLRGRGVNVGNLDGTFVSVSFTEVERVNLDARPTPKRLRANPILVDGKWFYTPLAVPDALLARAERAWVTSDWKTLTIVKTSRKASRNPATVRNAIMATRPVRFDWEYDTETSMVEVRTQNPRVTSPPAVVADLQRQMRGAVTLARKNALVRALEKRLGRLRADDTCCAQVHAELRVLVGDAVSEVADRIQTESFLTDAPGHPDYQGSTHIWMTPWYDDKKDTGKRAVKAWAKRTAILATAIQWLEPVLVAVTSTGKVSRRESARNLGSFDARLLLETDPAKVATFANRRWDARNQAMDIRVSPCYGQWVEVGQGTSWTCGQNAGEYRPGRELVGFELRVLNNAPLERIERVLETLHELARRVRQGKLRLDLQKRPCDDAEWKRIAARVSNGELLTRQEEAYLWRRATTA